jgi:hypothetical protein
MGTNNLDLLAVFIFMDEKHCPESVSTLDIEAEDSSKMLITICNYTTSHQCGGQKSRQAHAVLSKAYDNKRF